MNNDQRLVEMDRASGGQGVPYDLWRAATGPERAAFKNSWRAAGVGPFAPPTPTDPAPSWPSPSDQLRRATAALSPIYPAAGSLPASPPPPLSAEAALRMTWEGDPALRAEFREFRRFAAYEAAQARHRQEETRRAARRPVLLDPVALTAAAEKAWAEDRGLREEFQFKKASWIAYVLNVGPAKVGGRLAT